MKPASPKAFIDFSPSQKHSLQISGFYKKPNETTPYYEFKNLKAAQAFCVALGAPGIDIRPIAKRFPKFSNLLNYSQIFPYQTQSLVFDA